jgi:hypothetical protein
MSSNFKSRFRLFIHDTKVLIRKKPITCLVTFEFVRSIAMPDRVSLFTPFQDGLNCECICHYKHSEGDAPRWRGEDIYTSKLDTDHPNTASIFWYMLYPLGFVKTLVNAKLWEGSHTFPRLSYNKPPPMDTAAPQATVMHVRVWYG